MSSGYDEFAKFYDDLMYDVDYKGTAEFINSIIKEHFKELFKESSDLGSFAICDLGCGTGEICLDFARRGFDVIGIDSSIGMLDVASTKAHNENLDILFLQQDMTDFELYAPVKVFLCMLDGVNHVTNPDDLKRMFRCVKSYLEEDGLFVFDINTPYKLREIIGNNVFYDIDHNVSYIWESFLNEESNIVDYDLTFFIKDIDDLYRKRDVYISERIYEVDEICSFLHEAGLKPFTVYADKKFMKPTEKEERIYIVAKN